MPGESPSPERYSLLRGRLEHAAPGRWLPPEMRIPDVPDIPDDVGPIDSRDLLRRFHPKQTVIAAVTAAELVLFLWERWITRPEIRVELANEEWRKHRVLIPGAPRAAIEAVWTWSRDPRTSVLTEDYTEPVGPHRAGTTPVPAGPSRATSRRTWRNAVRKASRLVSDPLREAWFSAGSASLFADWMHSFFADALYGVIPTPHSREFLIYQLEGVIESARRAARTSALVAEAAEKASWRRADGYSAGYEWSSLAHQAISQAAQAATEGLTWPSEQAFLHDWWKAVRARLAFKDPGTATLSGPLGQTPARYHLPKPTRRGWTSAP